MDFLKISECQVKDVIKRRFNKTPVNIEPWIAYNECGLQVLNDNVEYYRYWFFDKPDISETALNVYKTSNPLYVGNLRVNVWSHYNNPVAAGDQWTTIKSAQVRGIPANYSIEGMQIKAFGNGIYTGSAYPAPGINIASNEMQSDLMIIAPWIEIASRQSAAAVSAGTASFMFSGYRVDLE